MIDVTEGNFQAAVLRSPVAVILQATASWCEPCKKLSPKLEQVVRAARGALVYARLDVDAEGGLAAQLGVRSLPTVWGLVLGKAVDTFQGLPSEERLRQFLETVITAAEGAGAMPGVGAGGGGSPLEQAAGALAAAGESMEAGRYAEALVPLRGIHASLQGVEKGFRDAQAAELAKQQAGAAAAGADAGKGGGGGVAPKPDSVLKRRAVNPVPREIQDLGARTLALLGAFLFLGGRGGRCAPRLSLSLSLSLCSQQCPFPQPAVYFTCIFLHQNTTPPNQLHGFSVRACCGQSQVESAGGETNAKAQALVGEASTYANLLRVTYKASQGMPEVTRALAAEAVAGRALEALRAAPLSAHRSAAGAAPGDAGLRLRLAEALLGVGRVEEAAEVALEALRLSRAQPGAGSEGARSIVLAAFELLGERHPATLAGRKALTRLLF